MFTRRVAGILLCGLLMVFVVSLPACRAAPKAHAEMFAGQAEGERAPRKYKIRYVRRHAKGGMRAVRVPIED